jgi:hypothetical protein
MFVINRRDWWGLQVGSSCTREVDIFCPNWKLIYFVRNLVGKSTRVRLENYAKITVHNLKILAVVIGTFFELIRIGFFKLNFRVSEGFISEDVYKSKLVKTSNHH